MPINRSLMDSLKNKYGVKEAERIYHAMESEGKPAFKKGLATAKREGHVSKPKRGK